MYYVTKQIEVSGAHRLELDYPSKCTQLHGHNWLITIHCRARELDRNGIMLSVACGLAESRGLKRVLIANHGGDHAIYPDCRPQFVSAMDAAMRAGTYAGVQLVAPYTDISKADIVRRGAQLGVDYGHTYSCYRGGEHHCGTCGTCTERKEAFSEAGIPDPTIYEN